MTIALQAVRAVGIAAQVLVVQWLLSGLLSLESENPDTGLVIGALLGIAMLSSLTAVAGSVLGEQQRLLGELTVRSVWERLLAVTGSVPLEAFESPGFFDRLQRVQSQAVNRPYLVVQSLVGLLGGLAGAVGASVALIAIAPVLLPLVALGAVPPLLAARLAGRLEFNFTVAQTPRIRLRDYFARVLTGRDEAKEVRAFELTGYLMGKHRQVNREFLEDLRAYLRRRAAILAGAGVGASFALAAAVGLVAWFVATGRLDVAAAGAAVVGARVLGQQVNGLVVSARAISESRLFLDDLRAFLADSGGYELQTPSASVAQPVSHQGFHALSADGISYRYPGSDGLVLDDVSLTLRRGEIVALVGENGSGKTTLSKVLTGLLPASQGQVRCDGRELVDFTRATLLRSTAVVFQDFVRYQVSAGENISLGDVSRVASEEAIASAAHAAGTYDLLARLPQGFDTTLSKAFGDGVDLSTGMWQRVALARAFYRNAPFIVLDEPAAALDARAEHALFSTLRELAAGRTVLFISHRFATVRDADRIVVMHDGRIVEQGSHDDLMSERGRYAEMFRLQASSYVGANSAAEW